IREAGPGGEFLTKKHTFQHMKELSQPFIFDRRNRAKWEADGAKEIIEIAYEKALTIIDSHEPAPLPEDVEKELCDMVDAYEREVL
ncbi:MAG: trimethylamine methyltransferase family protein, partial [Desulfovibrionales bacterium]|nr:trimethylamine methyltransferase family protein [Desulfovibrionales bacterium]